MGNDESSFEGEPGKNACVTEILATGFARRTSAASLGGDEGNESSLQVMAATEVDKNDGDRIPVNNLEEVNETRNGDDDLSFDDNFNDPFEGPGDGDGGSGDGDRMSDDGPTDKDIICQLESNMKKLEERRGRDKEKFKMLQRKYKDIVTMFSQEFYSNITYYCFVDFRDPNQVRSFYNLKNAQECWKRLDKEGREELRVPKFYVFNMHNPDDYHVLARFLLRAERPEDRELLAFPYKVHPDQSGKADIEEVANHGMASANDDVNLRSKSCCKNDRHDHRKKPPPPLETAIADNISGTTGNPRPSSWDRTEFNHQPHHNPQRLASAASPETCNGWKKSAIISPPESSDRKRKRMEDLEENTQWRPTAKVRRFEEADIASDIRTATKRFHTSLGRLHREVEQATAKQDYSLRAKLQKQILTKQRKTLRVLYDLEGQLNQCLEELYADMNQAAGKKNYRLAAELQQRIEDAKYAVDCDCIDFLEGPVEKEDVFEYVHQRRHCYLESMKQPRSTAAPDSPSARTDSFESVRADAFATASGLTPDAAAPAGSGRPLRWSKRYQKYF